MKNVKKTDLKTVMGMFEKAMNYLNSFVTTNKTTNKTVSKRVAAKTVTPKSVSTTKRICAISLKNNRKRYFKTAAECSYNLGVDNGNMSKVLHGKRKSAGGYRFEYVD